MKTTRSSSTDTCASIPIRNLAETALTARPEDPVHEVKRIIDRKEPIEAVVVVDGVKPVGLVMSLHLDRTLSHQFGFSLYHHKPVAKVMDSQPLVVDGWMPLEEAAGRAMDRHRLNVYDHLIVTADGSLCGIVSVKKMLATLVQLQQERARSLWAANHRLETEIQVRRHAETELRHSREMLRLVIDNFPHAIFWKDCNLVYMGCNRNFARHAGFPAPEAVIGKTDFDMAWEREEAEFYRSCDRQVIESDTPIFNLIESQQQAGGKQAYLDTNKIPLHDTEGRVMGILGMYEDITEKMHHREEKQKLETQLRRAEKMEAIGELASGVAHDLNNILSGIVSYPELILMDLPQDSPLRGAIAKIQQAGKRGRSRGSGSAHPGAPGGRYSRNRKLQPSCPGLSQQSGISEPAATPPEHPHRNPL